MNPTRPLKPNETHGCFVGSGECPINASHACDDGSGNEVYICLPHLVKFEALEKLIEQMPQHQVDQFAAAIREADRKQKDRAAITPHGPRSKPL